MTIAFTWEYTPRIDKRLLIKPIQTLKYSREAKSIFKYGLEETANYLLNPRNKAEFDIFKFCHDLTIYATTSNLRDNEKKAAY